MGKIVIDKNPKIVGVVSEKDIPFIKNQRENFDLLEIRIDLFKQQDYVYLAEKIWQIKKIVSVPLILTIRIKAEGGKNGVGDQERLILFESLLPLFWAIDIELASKTIIKPVIKKAKLLNKKIIVSYHNLRATPANLQIKKIIRQAKTAGADFVKIAAYAKSIEDVKRLLNLTYELKKQKIITIALGNHGRISRIVFPLVGSLLTYGSIGKAVAPGQIPLKLIRRQINPQIRPT